MVDIFPLPGLHLSSKGQAVSIAFDYCASIASLSGTQGKIPSSAGYADVPGCRRLLQAQRSKTIESI
jgi:hypothetical protein